MALNANTLKAEILKVMEENPHTPMECGQKWAQAYLRYAKEAQTAFGKPSTLPANQLALAASLAIVFSSWATTVPATAQRMAAAFYAFWFAPPVAFTGSFPGAVTAVLMPPQALAQALQVAWLSGFASRSNDTVAGNIARALDAFTRTVTVTTATLPNPTLGPLF